MASRFFRHRASDFRIERAAAAIVIGLVAAATSSAASMLVLTDEAFEEYGIDRLNRERSLLEQDAQARRAAQRVKSSRVDQEEPMFNGPAASPRGGGAIDPLTGLIVLGLAGAALGRRRGTATTAPAASKRHVQPE